MRETDGRKLDHKVLETLRIQAVGQVEDGAHPEAVAAAIGMNSATVYRWVATYREGGLEALMAKPIPGRPPKLEGPQVARLYTMIVGKDPRQLRFEFALWTRDMVREIIRREFGVHLSAASVGRLLRKMGLSPQRPTWLATQQNPDAIEEFKTEVLPQIRAEAAEAGGKVWFAHQAGVRSDDHAGTTWAPVGKTPVATSTGSRHSANMICAVAPDGSLRFSTYTGRFTSAEFIDFCKRLMHDADGPVYLVVDGHPTHRSKATEAFVESTGGKLELYLLPGYSPDLNPDEWVWTGAKAAKIGRAGITSQDDLRAKATSALRRLQKMPHLVRGSFRDPKLDYITA